ncbi:MAG: GNAT family N-acetyltransferase [Clostridia bacterium]|nr:GNAT family N-acetyltransferase [Clostridia bacterium]MBQ5601387.1 GNAT family N-acetyltransferase [Clostridia bacterium]
MAEILYKYLLREKSEIDSSLCIKWLSKEELYVFNDHLELCGQAAIDSTKWCRIFGEGTIYAGLFVDSRMVARACVEKYSNEAWEIADVRVAREFRNKGLAYNVCLYVLDHILKNKRTPTIRTEEDNYPMQKVILKLGFTSEI